MPTAKLCAVLFIVIRKEGEKMSEISLVNNMKTS